MRTIYNTGYKHTSKKGFSLSEMLLAVGLMAFVGTAAIGGIVVVSRIRDKLERETTANMIMIATYDYISADLNDCNTPATMNCASNGNVYYTFQNRYGLVDSYSNSKKQSAIFARVNTRVKYYNTANGIMVCCECDGFQWISGYYENPKNDQNFKFTFPGSYISNKKIYKYEYILAAEAIKPVYYRYELKSNGDVNKIYIEQSDTGMISIIGGDPEGDGSDFGKIIYDEENKLFKFWIYVVDKNNTNDVILAQYFEVCPDTLVPTSNP